MQNSLRQTLGEVTIEDIITNQRAALMQSIAEKMREEARKFGVDIIDVKIRRADYPGDIAERVYAQMSSARKEEAELIRAEGKRENTRIQAEAERDRAVILARANRTALEIQGQADATRNCIFAGAYDGVPVTIVEKDPSQVETLDEGESIAEDLATFDVGKATTISCQFTDDNAARDPARAEFFAFYRSLLAYEEALKKGDTTILLSPDSEFFRYFNSLEGSRQPSRQ
ncbi:MAG: SPFH domain-containing protein [Pseudomonadota bacterium]